MNDPIEMTPLERSWDDLQRFINRERYVQQSSDVRNGVVPPVATARHASIADQFNAVFGGAK